MSVMVDPEGVRRETYRVLSFMADASGRISVPALLGFMEEAAGNSARDLGFSIDDLAREGATWVLSRLRLRLSDLPAWREELAVETWPSGTDGLRAFREYRILRPDGRPVGAATSVWLVVRLSTRRPMRVTERFRGIPLPGRPRELGGVADDLPAPSRPSAVRDFRVHWNDLDRNRHANHARYVAWALETVPAEVRETGRAAAIAIDFRGEARLDDEVIAEAEAAGGETRRAVFLHRIRRPSDGKDLAVLRSDWEFTVDPVPRLESGGGEEKP